MVQLLQDDAKLNNYEWQMLDVHHDIEIYHGTIKAPTKTLALLLLEKQEVVSEVDYYYQVS